MRGSRQMGDAMTAEKIPWFMPQVGAREQALITAVIESNYINDGPLVRDLEKRLAERLDVKHAIAVTSGTAGISLALMAVGVGPGDEVIVPDLTFIATANAVRMTGADVRLVDVERHRFTMDPEKLRAAIGPRSKAVVPVDVNGRGCDYGAIEAICRERRLRLVCDAAEGLGSAWRGRKLATFGEASAFSFSANKTISSGQGGLVTTNSEEIYHRLKELKDQGRRYGGSGGDDLHPVMGFNFKYTNLQGAVAMAQLERLDERLAHFRERDAWYREMLAGCPGIVLPPVPNWEGEVLQWMDILADDRAAILEAFKARNIDSRAFWFPLHRQEPYKEPDAGFETALDISSRGLWLPSSFTLTKAQARRVADTIWAVQEKRKAL
jgi:perosamine synthetase